MKINKSALRSSLLANKRFFAELYQSNRLVSKKLLGGASEWQLKTLIKLLHMLAVGEVPIAYEKYEKVHFSRKCKYLSNTFGSLNKISLLLSAQRIEKLDALYKLCNVYCHLLHSLFHSDVGHS